MGDHHFDCHDIPFEDNSFDALMANHLLEHVADDRRVMSEFVRVLKPGGWAVSSAHQPQRRRHGRGSQRDGPHGAGAPVPGKEDHVRLYGHEDYPKRLAEAGFEVEVVDMMDLLANRSTAATRLGEEQAAYFLRKPLLDGGQHTRVSFSKRTNCFGQGLQANVQLNEHAMEKSVVAGWRPKRLTRPMMVPMCSYAKAT